MAEDFNFPYPVIGTERRPVDQGCRVCVHKQYCPAIYWWRRGAIDKGTEDWNLTDTHMGIACTSWSDDTADVVKAPATEDELDQNDYYYYQEIGSEANRNGYPDGETATRYP